MRMRSRVCAVSRAAAVGLAAALALLFGVLSGCSANFPRSGPVRVGDVAQAATEPAVLFSPSGPVDGASAEEIVRGFLAAATSAAGDYAVARSFLTGDAATRWNPYVGVTVDNGDRAFRQRLSDGKIALNMHAIAVVNERGAMQSLRTVSPSELEFGVKQVDGQWRVSSTPDGIVLDQDTFLEVFREHSLYFFAANSNVLLPDQRWFLRGATTATRIVSELLAGPSDVLAEGVTTSAFPEGTRLDAESVAVDDHVARVRLSAEAAASDERGQQLMLSQVEASLRNVVGVTSAELSVAGQPLLAGPARPEWVVSYPRTQGAPVVVKDDAFGVLRDGRVSSLSQLASQIVLEGFDDITYDAEADVAVGSSAAGVVLLREPDAGGDVAERVPLPGAPLLSAPALDRFGFVWSIAEGAAPSFLVTNGRGQEYSVVGPWTSLQTPGAPGAEGAVREQVVPLPQLAGVSRDGSRLLVVFRQGTETVVTMSGVVRDASGTPLRLTQPVVLQSSTLVPIEVDWVDESHVALMQALPEGGSSVALLSVGGFTEHLADAPDAVSIAAGYGVSELRVLTTSGELREYRGESWQVIAEGVQRLVLLN